MNSKLSVRVLQEIISSLADMRYQDSEKVIHTALKIYTMILIPYPLSHDTPLLAFYPPLRSLMQRPLRMTTEVQKYVISLPPYTPLPIYGEREKEDVLMPSRMRFMNAYQHALDKRTGWLDPLTTTRIDAPFPPLTEADYHQRVYWLVDHALTCPHPQSIEWWAEVMCKVATTSPSSEALLQLQSTHPSTDFRILNGWRQLGYIIEWLD